MSKNEGYVYFIKEFHSDTYKIGKTRNIDNRLKIFNVKLPFEWELVHQIKTTDYSNAEKLAHEYFADKRVNGEWFQLNESDIELIKSEDFLIIINQDNTPTLEDITKIHKILEQNKHRMFSIESKLDQVTKNQKEFSNFILELNKTTRLLFESTKEGDASIYESLIKSNELIHERINLNTDINKLSMDRLDFLTENVITTMRSLELIQSVVEKFYISVYGEEGLTNKKEVEHETV